MGTFSGLYNFGPPLVVREIDHKMIDPGYCSEFLTIDINANNSHAFIAQPFGYRSANST
jgi:hypothetical protein